MLALTCASEIGCIPSSPSVTLLREPTENEKGYYFILERWKYATDGSTVGRVIRSRQDRRDRFVGERFVGKFGF